MPHLRQAGAIYFITMRLADSLPADMVRAWKEELGRLAVDQEERRLTLMRRVEAYLDRPQGSCVLANERAGAIVEEALRHDDGSRYLLDEFCVMPNHVHALVMPLPGKSMKEACSKDDLTDIVGNWQRYTARQINAIFGTSGSLWEGEPMDHITRDTESLQRFRAYIRKNPNKVPHLHTVIGRGHFAEVTGI